MPRAFRSSDYLVKRSNRQHFLNFVGHGMQHGWDAATKSYFGHDNVEELEQAWLKNLRNTKRQPGETILAANTSANSNANNSAPTASAQNGRTVRLTIPAQSAAAAPPATARGAMPEQPVSRPVETQWEPGVRLESPVPILPQVPRIPPIPAGQR